MARKAKAQTSLLADVRAPFSPQTGDHDSYICWQRGSYLCDKLDRVLFVRVGGEKVPCTCICHKEVR